MGREKGRADVHPQPPTHEVTCPSRAELGVPLKDATEWRCPREKPAWYRAIILKLWGEWGDVFPGDMLLLTLGGKITSKKKTSRRT